MSNITKYEFNKIMEFFRNKTIDNTNYIIKILKKEDIMSEEFYRILGTSEFNITKDFISGKIPAEIIINLYNKYVNDNIFDYSISTLIDNFVDDEFIEKRNKIANLETNKEEKMNFLINAYNELYEIDKENRYDEDKLSEGKYIEKFIIPTKEVLIDFIIETISYNRKIRNLDELTIEEKENLMLQTKTHIIEKSNPNTSISVWLNIIDYQSDKKNMIDETLKTRINELDKIINPFLMANNLLNNIKYFDDILEIKTDVSDDNKNNNRFNNLEMSIRRKDTLDLEEISFKRDENEIKFTMNKSFNNNSLFYEHKYEKNNETLVYELTGDNYLYIELNLNNNTIFTTTNKDDTKDIKEFHSISESELEYLKVLMEDLINYANNITLNNMNDDMYFIKKLSNKKRK